MKSTILVFVITVLFMGCSSKQEEAETTFETASIKVESAKCDACVGTITDALMEVEGVKQVKVDLDKKVAEIQFIPVKVDLARLETAIVNAGYDANDKKRNSESYEKLPECCK
jgi:copper chaperone CopZ